MTMPRRMTWTIVYGLASAAIFLPAIQILRPFLSRPTAMGLVLWLILAGYGLMLAMWGRPPIGAVLFPLLVLFSAVFWAGGFGSLALTGAAVLGWLRSGVCFPDHWPTRSLAELTLNLIPAIALVAWAPGSLTTTALGLWLYFLIQAVYFVLFQNEGLTEAAPALDPWEQARQRAEAILSNDPGI